MRRGERSSAPLIRAIGGAVTVLVLYCMLPFASESTAGIVLRVVVATVAVAAMMVWQVNAILHAELPQLRAIDALAVSVSLMAVLFAATYESLSLHDPGSFTEVLNRTDALYFTFTTLTTIGYGDITARDRDGADHRHGPDGVQRRGHRRVREADPRHRAPPPARRGCRGGSPGLSVTAVSSQVAVR